MKSSKPRTKLEQKVYLASLTTTIVILLPAYSWFKAYLGGSIAAIALSIAVFSLLIAVLTSLALIVFRKIIASKEKQIDD